MTVATTHWFACGCGRHFVEHLPPSVKPRDARCPSCGARAKPFSIAETAQKIADVARKPKRTEKAAAR
jgi:hypothetical protein